MKTIGLENNYVGNIRPLNIVDAFISRTLKISKVCTKLKTYEIFGNRFDSVKYVSHLNAWHSMSEISAY